MTAALLIYPKFSSRSCSNILTDMIKSDVTVWSDRRSCSPSFTTSISGPPTITTQWRFTKGIRADVHAAVLLTVVVHPNTCSCLILQMGRYLHVNNLSCTKQPIIFKAYKAYHYILPLQELLHYVLLKSSSVYKNTHRLVMLPPRLLIVYAYVSSHKINTLVILRYDVDNSSV